jgi:uncharacterized protein with GYD domain
MPIDHAARADGSRPARIAGVPALALTKARKRQGIIARARGTNSARGVREFALEADARAQSREDPAMPTYIVLASFTGQGISNVKDTLKRAEAAKAAAKKAGATMKEIYWTLGQYDIVATFEAPDDATMTAVGLNIGKAGNVRTQTLRAFSAAEMKGLLGKVA